MDDSTDDSTDDDEVSRVWRRCLAGERVAVATVVRTWRSSPRPAGATMAVTEQGEVVGSVSGGCIEGAVYEVAQQVLAGGAPTLVHYGVGDDDAVSVGLTCGGTIEVFVELANLGNWSHQAQVQTARARRQAVAIATVVEGAQAGAHLAVTDLDVWGSTGSSGLDAQVVPDARRLLESGDPGLLRYPTPDGDVSLFVQPFAPVPALLVLGAIDFVSALARLGRFLGYHVTVCDARAVFATPARFPDAHAVVVDWPHRFLASTPIDDRTVICVLTHDDKYDVPALEVALRSPAAYVGAMGSRRTHETRRERLLSAGLEPGELARLHSPIGLDLGSSTSEETALSIMAEVLASRTGATGTRLRDLAGPIHRLDGEHSPVACPEP